MMTQGYKNNEWVSLHLASALLLWPGSWNNVSVKTHKYLTSVIDILRDIIILLGEFTMVSQPIRLILVDWSVFHFIF